MTEQEKQLKRIADLLECHLGDTDPVLPDDQDVLEDEFPVHAAMQLVVELMQAARATAEWSTDVRDLEQTLNAFGAAQRGLGAQGESQARVDSSNVLYQKLLDALKLNAKPVMTDDQISDMVENADGMRCVDGEYRIDGRDLMNLIRALKSQQDAAIESKQAEQSMPEGYVLVPTEPTQAMMDAGLYQSSHDSTSADVHSIWKDMVAAASESKPAGQSAWQPIETAPEDGTKVLLRATRYSMMNPEPETLVGSYSRGWWSNQAPLSYVTHWQSLPTPPVAAAIESQRSGDGS